MKKILISLSLISVLILPIIGLAQMRIAEPDDCFISHYLEDYPICCVLTDGVIIDNITYEGLFCMGPNGPEPFFPYSDVGFWNLIFEPYDFTPCCLIDKILTVGDYIFAAILVVAIIFILLSAWSFLTSSGEPEKVKKARNYLLFAVIGIAVAFLAKLLIKVVASIMV